MHKKYNKHIIAYEIKRVLIITMFKKEQAEYKNVQIGLKSTFDNIYLKKYC